MLPHVILHNAVSVDGRIDWFSADIGLYYELTSRWKVDIHLAGSNTIYNTDEEIPEEDEQIFEIPEKKPNDHRPLLVVPDSRGRVRNWHILRKTPYWRDMMALCSHSTPRTYLEYLQKRHIEYLITGDDHVDLRASLEKLSACYGARTVLLDSGGTLNGVLLRSGLVSEISLLIHPCLVGGTTPRSFFRGPDLVSSEGLIKLRLIHLEKVKDDIIWMRYEVENV